MEIKISSSLIFLALFLISLLFLINNILKSTKTPKNNSASKLPPGPWKLPLVGNMHQLFGSLPHRTLTNLARQYGPLMHIRLGQVPAIVVSSSDSAREVMKTHDSIFAFRPKTLVSEILLYDSSDIVFAQYGEYWRQLRKICTQELLSSARIQSLKRVREEEMFSFADQIGSSVGSVVNLTERIHSLTYSVTSRSAFGKKSKHQEEFISMVLEVSRFVGGFEITDLFPSFSFLATVNGTRARFQEWKRRGDEILDNIIDEHKEKKKIAGGDGDVEEDLVDVLLKYHDENDLGFSLTMDNIKAVILDIFSAGSDTSSTAVIWAMAEMMRNPRVMKKAQDDVRQVFRRKGCVDETFISEMKYLKAVVKETLRLHPPAALSIPRECSKKCEIKGYDIPEKTRVIINIYAIGRDPSYWTEPESFKPERFLDSNVDFKGTDFEYIPFGAGRRICPGMLFGITNIEFSLAVLLYHFDWKLPDGMEPEEFDMTELFGITVGRKLDLSLIPIAYDLSPIDHQCRGKIRYR